MIKFINKSKINWDKVQRYLDVSEGLNHYTNNGPIKKALEDKLKKMLDSSVLCVSSGTSALHLLMAYLVKEKGVKKFATTDFNFPSVMQTPYDVEIFDINPETGEPLITNNDYDAFILVNLFGSKVNTKAIPKDKIIIYDNCSSPIKYTNATHIGQFDKEIYPLIESYKYSIGSLHHTKLLGYGEGGFITCPTEDIKDELEKLSNFGFSIDKKWDKYGSNYKMSDISAAFILSHIDNLNITSYYIKQTLLINVMQRNGLEIFNYNKTTLYGNLPVIFPNKIDTSVFRNLGIEVQKYYKPLLGMKGAEELYDRIINFPISANMDMFEINEIEKVIKIIMKDGIFK